MTGRDDATLVEAIQNGDRNAFRILVDRHAPKFFALAYRFVRNREDAEDLLQDAFLRFWHNPFVWRPNEGALFTTWFHRVVVNRCLDHLRRVRSAAGGALRPADGEMPDMEDPSANAEETLVAAADEKELLQALAQLSAEQQVAIQLVYYDGYSQKDAADAMRMKLKAFESMLGRARRALRRHLDELELSDGHDKGGDHGDTPSPIPARHGTRL